MPINYTIDHEARLVRARAEGIITLKDIEDFSDTVVAQDALGYRKLFDAQRRAAAPDDDDVMVLAARASAYATLTARPPRPGAAAQCVPDLNATSTSQLRGTRKDLPRRRKRSRGWTAPSRNRGRARKSAGPPARRDRAAAARPARGSSAG
jgi:hypothetical protein